MKACCLLCDQNNFVYILCINDMGRAYLSDTLFEIFYQARSIVVLSGIGLFVYVVYKEQICLYIACSDS
jgi:hypothetical protein